jgi:hypothetical protein
MIRIDLEKLNKVDKKIIKKKTQLESILSMEIIEEINLKLLETLKIEDQTTLLILITILLQGGGSNKNAGNSVNAIYEGHTLTSKQLLEIIQQFKKKGTIRQYARGIADEIQTVASILEIEGDLAHQMKLDYPDLSIEDSVWCSNFQTRNSNCPENVRSWLNDNHKKRFKN